jgi:hypothetical protein
VKKGAQRCVAVYLEHFLREDGVFEINIQEVLNLKKKHPGEHPRNLYDLNFLDTIDRAKEEPRKRLRKIDWSTETSA